MKNMLQFESPDLFHLLWAIPLYGIVMLVYWNWRQRTLRQMGAPALAQRLLLGFSKERFWLKVVLFGLALMLVSVSLTNPRRPVTRQGETSQSADVFIALDVSESMLAKDVRPSRLGAAKDFALQLITALEGDRIGLVFFAGDAFPQMPLSMDYATAGAFIRSADPTFVIESGSSLGSAIALGTRSFDPHGKAGKALIILTDGEDHDGEALAQAKKAAQEGVRIYTVGVGTAAGATLMNANNEPKYFQGQVVRTKLNDETLRNLAKTGNGISVSAADGASAIRQLSEAVSNLQQSAIAARAYTEYVPYFQWLLLPAILLLVLEQVLWWRRR
jgi:Ca-activated chloride channel homolog